jgi:anthranilate phosphoribosyltransferase
VKRKSTDFLTLLSDKGEVSDEIAGGVYVLRQKSKRVNISDCVGHMWYWWRWHEYS